LLEVGVRSRVVWKPRHVDIRQLLRASLSTPLKETAWGRAWREFPETFLSLRGVALLLAIEAVGIGFTVYWTWDRSRWGQVAITVPVFLLGAGVVALLVFGALWVTAPRKQRDEARAQLEGYSIDQPAMSYDEFLKFRNAQEERGEYLSSELERRHGDPEATRELRLDLHEWDLETWSGFLRYHEEFAQKFGRDEFSHAMPTEWSKLREALNGKLARLAELKTWRQN
jgi:hypothetical protein